MSDRYISVGVVSGNLEAEMIKSYLQSLDIPCLLSEEAVGRVYGLGVGPLAEVEILVPSRYEQAAREAMQSYWDATGDPSST
jgi:hypothetical protein